MRELLLLTLVLTSGHSNQTVCSFTSFFIFSVTIKVVKEDWVRTAVTTGHFSTPKLWIISKNICRDHLSGGSR